MLEHTQVIRKESSFRVRCRSRPSHAHLKPWRSLCLIVGLCEQFWLADTTGTLLMFDKICTKRRIPTSPIPVPTSAPRPPPDPHHPPHQTIALQKP